MSPSRTQPGGTGVPGPVAGRVRSTAPLPAPLDAVGQKSFRRGGLREAVKRRFLGSPARREWRNTRSLAGRGVPVPEALSYEDGAGPRGEDLYRFRWLGDHRDLQAAVLEDGLDLRQRRRVAAALGHAVRLLHDAGYVHRDLHAANVLVGPDDSVVLADFHRARRGRGRRARRRDLLGLAHFFLQRARPTEFLRFLKAYGEPVWHRDRARRHQLLRALALDARRSLHRFLRHHERRCLGGGRAFEPIEVWNMRGVADRRQRDTWTEVSHQDPDRWLRSAGAPLHSGGRARVYRVPHRDHTLIVKVFEEPGGAGLLKTLFRGSLARRAWLGLHRLRMIGLRTPEPVMFLEQEARSRRRRSLLLMSDEPFVHLGTYLGAPEASRRAPRDPGLDPVLAQLAAQVAAAHDHGLRNRDLKAENLLVDESRGEPVWLDPDGVRPVGLVDSGTAARDLMRLNASFPEGTPVRRTLRLRFLRRYHAQRRTPVDDLPSLWRHVHQLTLAKWNRRPEPPR